MKKFLVLLAVLLFFGINSFAANGDLIVNGNFNLLPAGTIAMYGGSTAPTGWLLCNGTAVSRTTYATLFASIGTTYGAGDGSTTFNLPDFRRRVAVGAGGTATTTLGNSVGSNGGEETHTLTVGELPSHTHSYNTGNSGASAQGLMTFPTPVNGYDDPARMDTVSIGNTGGGQPYNNMQPSLVVNYIIKY